MIGEAGSQMKSKAAKCSQMQPGACALSSRGGNSKRVAGQRHLYSGNRRMAVHGGAELRMAMGRWGSVAGASGCWCWLLALGYWLLA